MLKYKMNTPLIAFGLLLAACSQTVTARNVPPAAVLEPATRRMEADAFFEALADDAVVEKVGEVTQPFFSVPGQVFSLNGSQIQLFVYEDMTAATSEAGQVSPEGTAVGPHSMMWMATPHFYHVEDVIVLYIGDDKVTLALLAEAFGPPFAGGQMSLSSDEISEAALAGLQQVGWDINGFSAETTVIDGDYARVTITSTDPPGGFTAFMKQKGGHWTVAAHGSAYNPDELKTMGFPDSVLP